jgi:hypothetical protein
MKVEDIILIRFPHDRQFWKEILNAIAFRDNTLSSIKVNIIFVDKRKC